MTPDIYAEDGRTCTIQVASWDEFPHIVDAPLPFDYLTPISKVHLAMSKVRDEVQHLDFAEPTQADSATRNWQAGFKDDTIVEDPVFGVVGEDGPNYRSVSSTITLPIALPQ